MANRSETGNTSRIEILPPMFPITKKRIAELGPRVADLRARRAAVVGKGRTAFEDPQERQRGISPNSTKK